MKMMMKMKRMSRTLRHSPDDAQWQTRLSTERARASKRRKMKRCFPALSALFAVLLFASCESDMPPEPSAVPSKLQRGMRGQGTLYQPDRTGDPVIREESRVGY